MSGVCILTDSTAQFPALAFPGQQSVCVLPLQVHFKGVRYPEGKELKIADLPPSLHASPPPRARPPSPEEFRQAFFSLSSQYDEIIAILLAGALNPAVQNAQRACSQAIGRAQVTVVDSQTAGVGLGLLVQAAAEAAQQGATGSEIKKLVRNLVGHIYTLFCVQGLSYLSGAGLLDPAQSIIGELLNLTALFVIENGRLVAIHKARNARQLVDLLHEFVLEFSDIQHVALSRGVIPFDSEARSLRERIGESFPNTPYSEHLLGTALAAILGPRSLGLVTMDR